jgi:predicted phage gp36 major capsid-like protein
MTTHEMTRDQAVERMTCIHQRVSAIASKHRTSRGDDAEFAELQTEFSALQRLVDDLDRSQAIAGAAGGSNGRLRIDRGSGGTDSYAGERRGGSPQRDAALRQLESSVKGGLPARSAEVVERLVETGPDHERSWTQRWVTDTGADLYKSAFAKLVAFGEARAGLEWSAGEREAFNRVARLKQEQRAMSLTDSAGGFLTPFEIDFSVILTSAGSANPLVQISRVVSTVSDVWHGVASSGVVSSWDAEASEVSDDSTAFSEPAIPCFKSATLVPFSIEISQDAPTRLTELGRLMADSQLQLVNEALTVGSGTGSPTGIVTALTGGSSVVATTTNDVLVADDVYKLQSSLGPRWQANARWCFNLAVLNMLRQ